MEINTEEALDSYFHYALEKTINHVLTVRENYSKSSFFKYLSEETILVIFEHCDPIHK